MSDGVVARSLPSAIADSIVPDGRLRLGRYGEQYVQALLQKAHGLADEGAYFLATNPTPATGVATIAAQATLVDTAPFILVKNGGTKRVYLDQLVLIATAPGTAGTALHFAAKLDTGNSARYTSGGAQVTPVNVNGDDGTQSGALVYAGAILAGAAVSPRLLSHRLVRPVIPVIGDTYVINFGGLGSGVGGLIPSGTAIAQQSFDVAPVVIGPNQWAALHIWLPSQSAASSFEFELGYFER